MRALFISLTTLLALAGCRSSNNEATGDADPGGARTDELGEQRTRVPADIPDRIPTPKVGDPANTEGLGGAGPAGHTGYTGSTMGNDGLVRPGGGTLPGTTGTIGPDGGIEPGGPVMDRGVDGMGGAGGAGSPAHQGVDDGAGGAAVAATPSSSRQTRAASAVRAGAISAPTTAGWASERVVIRFPTASYAFGCPRTLLPR